MPRLPQPGGDDNTWGDVLNQYLLSGHNSDGTHDIKGLLGVPATAGKVPVTDASGIGFSWQDVPASTNIIAAAEKGAANGIASLDGSGTVPDAQIPSGIARTSALISYASSASQPATKIPQTDGAGGWTYVDPPSSLGVPPGGTAGQILIKNSSTDYDYSWVDAPVGYIPGSGSNAIVTDGAVVGGDATGTYTDGSVTYRWHIFTSTGGTQNLVNDEPFIGQMLIVGAGGGGGGQSGGTGNGNGGGGGTVWYGDYAFGLAPNGVDPGVHTCSIGIGSGGVGYGGTGVKAGDTRFDDIICYGGGGGSPEAGAASNGGSGGRFFAGTQLGGSLDAGVTTQTTTPFGFYCTRGDAGGGAIGSGGFVSTITGTSVSYGGAGADGSLAGGIASFPVQNTGTGGGGAGRFVNAAGATGANGVVVVRYRIA